MNMLTMQNYEFNQWAAIEQRWSEIILTFPLYILAFGSLGFCLASSGFSRGYCFLTVFFTFIITLLLPVIFQTKNMPDSVFSLYYLSPITIWESLDTRSVVIESAGLQYVVLGGIAIVDFAKFFFAALCVIFVGWGGYLARRKNFPLVKLRS